LEPKSAKKSANQALFMLAAEQYRAKAAEYTELLKAAASLSAEGEEFRRLKRSYLVLAENEEWMADNHEKLNITGADENCYGDAILAPDRAFDDTWATFRISADGVDNCPFPIGTKVKMRLLHNFQIRDGMIAKEVGYEVWRRDE